MRPRVARAVYGASVSHTPSGDPAGAAVTADADAPGTEQEPPPLPLLAEPADGVPPLVDTTDALLVAAMALSDGHGPVAVDAERASGYRYGQDAYLVQLRRAGSGTVLIDPAALPDLSSIGEALGEAEWILHAANQDLPCLAGVGLRPGGALFDTELGARIAGFERVGLSAVVERLLGLRLAKEHSAADWSTRPLPQPWLVYAALDVEVLLELREALAEVLGRAGKLEWAIEEFEAVRDAPPPAPRAEPWRRVSGLSAVRGRRRLAVVRELWTARDELARGRDTAPGRVLPDRAVVDAAMKMPASTAELAGLPVFSGPAQRRQGSRWMDAIDRGKALPEEDLPTTSLRSTGPPPARAWRDREPAAAARLTSAKDALATLSESLHVPQENLVPPDAVRRLCWEPPAEIGEDTVSGALEGAGARAWQVALVTGPLTGALAPVAPAAQTPAPQEPAAT